MRTELAGAPRRSIPGVFRNRVVSCGGCYSPPADVDAGARRISLEGTGAIFAPVPIDQPIANANTHAKTTSTKHRNAKNVDQCARSLVCTASTGSCLMVPRDARFARSRTRRSERTAFGDRCSRRAFRARERVSRSARARDAFPRSRSDVSPCTSRRAFCAAAFQPEHLKREPGRSFGITSAARSRETLRRLEQTVGGVGELVERFRSLFDVAFHVAALHSEHVTSSGIRVTCRSSPQFFPHAVSVSSRGVSQHPIFPVRGFRTARHTGRSSRGVSVRSNQSPSVFNVAPLPRERPRRHVRRRTV